MIAKLKELFKYRQLILTLVSRELKARYRGTVFGFLWSFLNPLLLLLVYSIVFGIILPQSSGRIEGADLKGIDYAIFLFSANFHRMTIHVQLWIYRVFSQIN